MNVREERERLMGQVRKVQPGPQALVLLAELRRDFDLAIDGYRNALTILSDTTYQDRKHFLLELIQNADDASFTHDPTLTFRIYDDSIELVYNEQGFTVEDVLAITGTGASTKTSKKMANSFIGEKGIGFKSVFALASKVEIESPPWHFVLSSNTVIVPEPIEEGTLSAGQGTRIRVYFHDTSIVDSIARELEKYLVIRPESFLFLQRLSQFVLVDGRHQGRELNRLTLSPASRAGDVLTLTQEPHSVSHSYVLFHEDMVFPGDLVAERWERLGNSAGPLSRRLTVAAQVGGSGLVSSRGRLFCFLPTSVTLPIPIYLQVDGHTKADREQLHDPETNRWNRHLLAYIPRFLSRAILAWRETKIGEDLLSYIPTSAGEGQLASEIKELMETLKDTPWVRTTSLNDPWAAPPDVVVPSSFLQMWFKRSPDFQAAAERVLNKKFVDPAWTSKPEWSRISERYGIKSITGPDEALVFRQASLPEKMFREPHLTELYTHLEELSRRWKHSQVTRNNLLTAPLFPISGKFQPLIGKQSERAYWISTRSTRSTGLENLVDFKIIDPSFTVNRAEPGKGASPERVQEITKINQRNVIIRSLLANLGVHELNDDTVLTELQIPFLRTLESSNQDRLSVLRQIFEGYRAKRELDNSYLHAIREISSAMFLGNAGTKKPLKVLLLPPELRQRPEDHVFVDIDSEYLRLPNEFLMPTPGTAKNQDVSRDEDRKVRLLNDWRAFLIHCGILAGPKFRYVENNYRGDIKYGISRPERHRHLAGKANHMPSRTTPIQETEVLLDRITLELIQRGQATKEVVKAIYSEWERRFGRSSKALWEETSPSYPFSPPPGYVKVSYARRGQQNLLLRDSEWAGIRVKDMPVVDVMDNVVPSRQARRLKVKLNNPQAVATLIPIVTEKDCGNNKELLDSLDIPVLTISDINDLWTTVQATRHDEVVKAIIELVQCGFDPTGLCLWDKVESRIRPAVEFRLGKVKRAGVPLIEDQYGGMGRTLGKLIELGEETEATALIEKLQLALTYVMDDEVLDAAFQHELISLMARWSNFTPVMKRSCIVAWTQVLDTLGVSEVVMVWNQAEIATLLKSSRTIVSFDSVENETIKSLQLVAQELGFRTLESLGSLTHDDATSLSSAEKYQLDFLLDSYKEVLEPEELKRFEQLLTQVGGADVSDHILRVNQLNRQVAIGVSLPLAVPYLDVQQGVLYVTRASTLNEVAARLLTLLQFTNYRSAIREFKSVRVPSRVTTTDEPVLLDTNDKLDKLDFALVSLEEDGRKGTDGDEPVAHSSTVSRSSTNVPATPSNSESVRSAHSKLRGTSGFHTEQSEKMNKLHPSERSGSSHNAPSKEGVYTSRHNAMQEPAIVNPVREDTQNTAGEEQWSPPQTLVTTSRSEVREQVREQLASRAQAERVSESREWRLGMSPDEESSMREELLQTAEMSLRTGGEFREKLKRKVHHRSKVQPDGFRVVDKFAGDPKEFLLSEYNGQCQVCGTELVLANGRKWFEVFRIVEQKDSFWANRPYNILGLCPNCHALGKYGGGTDLSSIEVLALEAQDGSAFPIEIEEFNGDFYVTDIVFSGQSKRLVVGKNHLAHFISLFATTDSEFPNGEEVNAETAATSDHPYSNIND